MNDPESARILRDEVHEATCVRVRRLLDDEDQQVSQRALARLFGCDVSSVNRALIIDDRSSRHRRREWRHWEVVAISQRYAIPLTDFSPEQDFARIQREVELLHRDLGLR